MQVIWNIFIIFFHTIVMLLSKDLIKNIPDLIANRINCLHIQFLGKIILLNPWVYCYRKNVEFFCNTLFISQKVYHVKNKKIKKHEKQKNHTNSKLILKLYIQQTMIQSTEHPHYFPVASQQGSTIEGNKYTLRKPKQRYENRKKRKVWEHSLSVDRTTLETAAHYSFSV